MLPGPHHFFLLVTPSPTTTVDPPDMEMYVRVGTSSDGLAYWRCVRGSSKNEAINLVVERGMHTTGQMEEDTGLSKCRVWDTVQAHAVTAN